MVFSKLLKQGVMTPCPNKNLRFETTSYLLKTLELVKGFAPKESLRETPLRELVAGIVESREFGTKSRLGRKPPIKSW